MSEGKEQELPEGAEPAGESPQEEVEPRGKKPKGSTPESELRALEVVLRRTGRKIAEPLLLEGALWYGVTLLAVVLSGLAVAALFGEGGYTIGRWMMGLGLLSATMGAAVAGGLYWLRRPSEEEIARRVQRHSTEFRSDLVAALEFGRALKEDGGEALRSQGFSEAMARAHLSNTVKRVLEKCEGNSLAHLLPERDLTPPTLAMTGGVVLLMVPFFLNGGWTLGVLTGERLGTPVVGERVVSESLVGYVDGVFVYPSYTGMDRQMMRLGSGYIESIEGTTVHLRVALRRGDLQELEMVIEGGDEEPVVVEMGRDEGSFATATMVLEKSGEYWFRGKTSEGRPVEDRTPRRIRVIADEAPQVRVLSHEGRVEVQPDDVVVFEFAASDDFGLDGVTVVRHFEGGEENAERERLNLPALSRQPRDVEGEFTLDLEPLNLQPKDAVVIYFEARDNNTATGPGIGKSAPVVLYVESPEDRHLENIGRQQEVMVALLMHLADFLESPVGERFRRDDDTYGQRVEGEPGDEEREERFRRVGRLHESREVILEEMRDVVKVLDVDPLMVPRNQTMFEGLLYRLEELQRRGGELFQRLERRANRSDLTVAHLQEVADYAAVSEEELERGILSLEELLVQQKMDLVKSTAEDIEALRQRLRELIEQYRDTEDPALREAIQREIERLRQRMTELMARMQMQLEQMPREHVNMEALEQMQMESSAREMQDQLRAIEDLLDSGDIDGALAALDELELGLDELTREMSDSFDSMEPEGISELDQAVAEMMDEVNQLEEIERAIEEETREFQESLREERQEQLERMLEPMTRELLEEIEAQERSLERMEQRSLPGRDQTEVERARQRVDSLRDMVEQQDMQQALERARRAQNSMRSLRSTLNLSERYVQQGTEQGENVQRSRRESEGMVERADQITQKIEEFMEQAQQNLQSGEAERFEELAQGQQSARERAQQLRERMDQEGQRFPAMEQQLRPSMEATEEAMGQAEQALRERRLQDALDQERRAIEQLGQLRQSMSEALEQQRRQDREQSGREQRQDRVEIPGEESRENRERLRREMMEGMREGRLGEYESQIERYFRSLVE